MANLSDRMQERLEKWRKNTLPVPSAEKVFGPRNNSEELSDEEKLYRKEKEAWEMHKNSFPGMFRR